MSNHVKPVARDSENARVASTNPESELKLALEAFEVAVATPIVSGDLSDWIETLQKTWAEVSAQVQRTVQESHAKQYEQIGEQDPELLPRIELLTAEDEAIAHEREKLDNAVTRVAQHVPKLEPDEQKAQKFVKPLIDDSMAFVARVKKQAVAVQTWYVEAFTRDRGAVD
jgi:hypothetical protein